MFFVMIFRYSSGMALKYFLDLIIGILAIIIIEVSHN